MGCRAICFPREILWIFCLEEVAVQAWTARGQSRDTRRLGPGYKKVGWRTLRKGLAQTVYLSNFFLILLLFISPMVILWIQLHWEQIPQYFPLPLLLVIMLLGTYWPNQFTWKIFFSVLLKWSFWQKGKHLCTCVLFFPNYSLDFMCLPKPISHHNPYWIINHSMFF